jgi:hypothetical protein
VGTARQQVSRVVHHSLKVSVTFTHKEASLLGLPLVFYAPTGTQEKLFGLDQEDKTLTLDVLPENWSSLSESIID